MDRFCFSEEIFLEQVRYYYFRGLVDLDTICDSSLAEIIEKDGVAKGSKSFEDIYEKYFTRALKVAREELVDLDDIYHFRREDSILNKVGWR